MVTISYFPKYVVGGILCVKDSGGSYWKVENIIEGIRIFGVIDTKGKTITLLDEDKVMAEKETDWNAKDARIMYQNAVNRAFEIAVHTKVKADELVDFIKDTANDLAEFMWNAGNILGNTDEAPVKEDDDSPEETEEEEEEHKKTTKKTTKKKTSKKTRTRRTKAQIAADKAAEEESGDDDLDLDLGDEEEELPVPTPTQEKIMGLIAEKLEVDAEAVQVKSQEVLGHYPKDKAEAQKVYKEMK